MLLRNFVAFACMSTAVAALDTTPAQLVADMPMDQAGGALLPVKIHGKAATIAINLQDEGDLQLSTAALARLGVTLTSQSLLDSLHIGPVRERRIPIKLFDNPDWEAKGPANLGPVIGIVGRHFLERFDLEYSFPAHRIRLYAVRKTSAASAKKSEWLPAGIKPSDCGAMVTVPPGAGTFTGMKMQLNGHPVTGVIEMGPYYEKMNRNAVYAMGLTEQSPELTGIDRSLVPVGYSHNGFPVTQQMENVQMTVGTHKFWSGTVQIFPVLDVEAVLGNKVPVMLMNLSTIREVVLFNSNSSRRVCISAPSGSAPVSDARPTDTASTATTSTVKPSVSSVVELLPAAGSLNTQLIKAIAETRAAGMLPIVEIGDKAVCPPCVLLDNAMKRPALAKAFARVRLIKLSPVAWGAALGSYGFCGSNPDGSMACAMPRFFGVDAEGNAIGAGLAPDTILPDAEATATAMAPQFTKFFSPLLLPTETTQ